jgi:hypothetical protein
MQNYDVYFNIRKENVDAALKAIKEMPISDIHYSWVEEEEYRSAETLEDAMKAWGWCIDTDKDGNVDSIYFDWEKIGEEFQLFKAIAPYVEPESYIAMIGEDSTIWRWYFDGKTCVEQEVEEIIWK